MIWILLETILAIVTATAIAQDFIDIGWIAVPLGSGAVVLIWIPLQWSGTVLACQVKLGKYRRNLATAKVQHAAIQKTVMELVDKYPMEQEMMGALPSGILLKLPEIKSNSLLATAMDEINSQHRNVSNYQRDVSKIQSRLDWHRQIPRWLSLNFTSTAYSESDERSKGNDVTSTL